MKRRRRIRRGKVLIVCSETFWQYDWAQHLGSVDVISAYSVEEADQKMSDEENIIVIVCVGDETFSNTEPWIRGVRKRFSGPIIGASPCMLYRRRLMDAGCDHECEKLHVPQKLMEVLHDLPTKAGSR